MLNEIKLIYDSLKLYFLSYFLSSPCHQFIDERRAGANNEITDEMKLSTPSYGEEKI